MSFLDEVLTVARYELSGLFGARGALVLAGYGTVSLGAGGSVLFIAREITAKLEGSQVLDPATAKQQILAELAKPELKDKVAPLLSWLRAEGIFDEVVQGRMPWLVAFVLLFSTFVLSGLVFLAVHDRIASDLTTGFSRYIFLRVRRESYLLGKLAGAWAGIMAIVVLVHVALLVVAGSTQGVDIAEIVPVLPKVWLGLGILVLGYCSVTLGASALLGRPFAVLALGSTLLFILWIASFSSTVRAVWMGNWDIGLLALDLSAVGVFLAHSVVGLGLAWWGIARRDI
ncbi:MAG: hypothetical protein HYV07_25405 [Deltaproteobacteria bacterium]|nr:hypothetical protein [Deltaproteobacteria bacterium]